MAEKKHKKPRHTNLVVPGEKKTSNAQAKDRIGRTLVNETDTGEKKTNGTQAKGATANIQPNVLQTGDDNLPQNAIKLPDAKNTDKAANKTKKKGLSPVRRKRRKRRVGFMVLVLLILGVIVFFSTGAYTTIAALAADMFEGIRIAARPGDGFPMPLAMTGFVNAESMGGNGFAVLGSSDFTMVSPSGSQLRSVHHGYLYPGMSAAKTRVVIYNRGGRELLVEGRSRNMATIPTEHEIIFATLSPDGWLLVASTGQYTANIDVYGPDYNTAEPLLHWTMNDTDGMPHMAAFNSNNRNFALGCLNTSSGALSTTLYLLRTDQGEPIAQLNTEDAVLLDLAYIAGGRLIAIYNTHTALYSQDGTEIANYSYGGKMLLNSSTAANGTALLFGSDAGGTANAVLLNNSLETMFETTLTLDTSSCILAVENGLVVLTNQTVYAYSIENGFVGSIAYEPKAYKLVDGGQPLVVLAGSVQPIKHLYEPPEESIISTPSGSLQTSVASEDGSGL